MDKIYKSSEKRNYIVAIGFVFGVVSLFFWLLAGSVNQLVGSAVVRVHSLFGGRRS